MKSKFPGSLVTFFLLFALSGAIPTLAFSAAVRDYLTPQEEEQVKEAQIIDKRIEVFIKVAERRLLVLTGTDAASSRQVQKDMEKWGELPKGTRAELIMDVANILDAASTNIDDVAMRDEKNPLLPKALRELAEAATRFQAQLTSLREQAQEGAERKALEQVMENVQEILGAASKLPPEVKKKK
jgi:acyl-CoA reductase-like NAD-dependent aldehyde dehydrogenase